MLLRLKVKPNSKSDSISIGNDGILRVRIHALPVDGKANKYLVKYLSNVFKLPKSAIEIVKGPGSSFKTISIEAEESRIISVLKSLKKE